MAVSIIGLVVAAGLSACGGAAPADGAVADDGGASDGPTGCRFAPLPPTANAGKKVTPAEVQAGAAEVILDLPVGSALGGFTARAMPISDYGNVDRRTVEQSGSFNPSVGIETFPRVKAVAITSGEETVVLLHADLIFSDAAATADVAARLGPEYAGKVLFATSHSHNVMGQFSTNSALAVGIARFRNGNYERLVSRLTEAARAAIAARRPAQIGIAVDTHFDPNNDVSHDRRGENDKLAGGSFKDSFLAVIRVDGMDGKPIAFVDVFGVHGTVIDADNALASTDAPGAIERALEESFDDKVVVMHLQGAAGDVSPGGHGGTNRDDNDVAHYNFARSESIGRLAAPMILPVYQRAGLAMQHVLPLQMVTRSVPLGPDSRTFKVRADYPSKLSGPVEYAPFDYARTTCDGKIFDDTGKLLSPIDEFNAPFGAALCGDSKSGIFINSSLSCTEKLKGYSSCNKVDVAIDYLGRLLRLPPFEAPPVCASTRTQVSAIRLGDYLIAALPGEPLTLLADRVRQMSPVAPEKTIVVGYSQGHVGYLLTAEDWLQGGYEPSINFWGPLEGEYIAERAADMMKLAMSDTREDAAKGGADRLLAPTNSDADLPPPDPAPSAGQVPAAPSRFVYMRGLAHPKQGQPEAQIQRLVDSARFVWIGEDPMTGTPHVTLQREATPGTFADVTRRSGRAVQDGDVLLVWNPDPLYRRGPVVRTNYWAAEWQAVTWTGTKAQAGGPSDDVEDRAGVPVGKYRFHVEGAGYKVDSAPFEVVAGPIAVAVKSTGQSVGVDAAYSAPQGWRLLAVDDALPSNKPVPVARGPLDLEITLGDGSVLKMPKQALTSRGHVDAMVPAGATVKQVKVTDRFGNTGLAAP